MTDRRRQLLLLALLAVAAAVLVLRQLGGAGAGDVLSGLGFSGGESEEDGGVVGEVAEVRLDLLEGQRGQYSPGRNPFRFQAAQPKPQPPRQPPPPPRQAPPPRQPPPQAAARPAKPQPPRIDFVYLGSFGPDRGKIAVFTDRTDIYNARIGDVIKEQFVVVEIGYESADVGFVGFPDEPAKRLAAGG